ncbi:hypothetical protein PROFUN_00269 [Planoprotostelium fungivorum]|uniref:Uncharacterized protein n=1 Tax=Planoprotostelium fungivorum TaxID=1890364 RepID=A0A2P6NXW9_9EUKA|nr:hypothetical protein PROFUN_00269 [Planoprotostelium fungivorum]
MKRSEDMQVVSATDSVVGLKMVHETSPQKNQKDIKMDSNRFGEESRRHTTAINVDTNELTNPNNLLPRIVHSGTSMKGGLVYVGYGAGASMLDADRTMLPSGIDINVKKNFYGEAVKRTSAAPIKDAIAAPRKGGMIPGKVSSIMKPRPTRPPSSPRAPIKVSSPSSPSLRKVSSTTPRKSNGTMTNQPPPPQQVPLPPPIQPPVNIVSSTTPKPSTKQPHTVTTPPSAFGLQQHRQGNEQRALTLTSKPSIISAEVGIPRKPEMFVLQFILKNLLIDAPATFLGQLRYSIDFEGNLDLTRSLGQIITLAQVIIVRPSNSTATTLKRILKELEDGIIAMYIPTDYGSTSEVNETSSDSWSWYIWIKVGGNRLVTYPKVPSDPTPLPLRIILERSLLDMYWTSQKDLTNILFSKIQTNHNPNVSPFMNASEKNVNGQASTVKGAMDVLKQMRVVVGQLPQGEQRNCLEELMRQQEGLLVGLSQKRKVEVTSESPAKRNKVIKLALSFEDIRIAPVLVYNNIVVRKNRNCSHVRAVLDATHGFCTSDGKRKHIGGTMESIVTKMLRKYLSLFINNFSKDNFNLSIMKGRGEYRNLELNNQVIQEVLWIPTNLTVQKATCNLLNINVHWTKLSSVPIVISLDRVEFYVSEPVDITAMPSILSDMKSSGGVSMSQREILMGVTIEINEIIIKVQTQPPKDKINWNPQLHINMKKILVQSTNAAGEVVELSKTRVVDPKDPTTLHLFKSIQVTSASAWVDAENGRQIPIIYESPLTVALRSRFHVTSGAWLGGETEVTYDNLRFAVDTQQYDVLSGFISSLKNCMARPVPEGQPKELNDVPVSTVPAKANAPATAATTEEYETALKFVVRNWNFMLQSETKGVGLHGTHFAIHLNSSRKIHPETKRPEYHTHFGIEAPDIHFENLDGGKGVGLLTSSHVDSAEDSARLLSIGFDWVTQPQPDSTWITSRVGATLQLSGMQILLDNDLWESSYSFLVDKQSQLIAPNSPAPDSTAPAKDVPSGGGRVADVKKSLAELKDLNDAKVTIEASNIVLLLPPNKAPVPEVLGKNYQNKGLRFSFGRVYLSNEPKWEVIPPLQDKMKDFFESLKTPSDEEAELQEQKQVLERVQKFSNQKGSQMSRISAQAADPLTPTLERKEGAPPIPSRATDSPSTNPSRSEAPPVPQRRRPSLEDVVPASYVTTATNARETLEKISSKFHADSVYKVEFDFTQVGVDFVDFSAKEVKTAVRENIFHADGIQLFARYQHQDNSGNSAVEVVIVGLDELLLDVNVQQLYHSSQLVQNFHHRAQGTPIPSPSVPKPSPKPAGNSAETSEGKLPDVEAVVESTIEKLKKKMDEKADYIQGVDVDKIDGMIDVEYISSAGQYIRDISSRVKDIMATSHLSFIIQINRVFFSVPLKAFDGLDKPHEYVRNITDSTKQLEISRVTSFGFDIIELGVHYEPRRQTFVFREKGLQTKDWQTSPGSSMTVTPAPVTPRHISRVFKLDAKRDFNLSVYGDRKFDGERGDTKVHVQLRDFQIYLQSEKAKEKVKGESVVDRMSNLATAENLEGVQNAAGEKALVMKEKANDLKEKALELKEQYDNSHMGLPYVQKLIQDAVEWFDSRRETFTKKFEEVRSKVEQKKDSISGEIAEFSMPSSSPGELRWEMEMDDVEVRMISGDNSTRPHAAVKLSNRKQRRQVVDSHLELLRKVEQLEEQVKAQHEVVSKAAVWEEKYISAKVELSTVQMQMLDMEREYENLRFKVGMK